MQGYVSFPSPCLHGLWPGDFPGSGPHWVAHNPFTSPHGNLIFQFAVLIYKPLSTSVNIRCGNISFFLVWKIETCLRSTTFRHWYQLWSTFDFTNKIFSTFQFEQITELHHIWGVSVTMISLPIPSMSHRIWEHQSSLVGEVPEKKIFTVRKNFETFQNQ